MPPSVSEFRRYCLRAATYYRAQAQADPDSAQALIAAERQAQDAAAICRLVDNEARQRTAKLLRQAGMNTFAEALETGCIEHHLGLPKQNKPGRS